MMSIMLLNFSLILINNKSNLKMIPTIIILMSLMCMCKYPINWHLYSIDSGMMLDSLSMIMISLSMWITALMSLTTNKMKAKNLFTSTMIVLLSTFILLFSINNLMLMYFLFETSLIPVLMMIMLWGTQPERKNASLFIMMYTVSASLPMFMILLKLLKTNCSTYMLLEKMSLPVMLNQYASWTMLIMAFMVKLPMYSMHAWLPKAHVEAPLAGSMVLAAIMLKLGAYGFIRMSKMISVPMPPVMSYMLISMASISSVFINMMCLRIMDLKALIAYSSVSHMGLLIISMASNSKLGMFASFLMMLTHGLTSSCMFMLTDIAYKSSNSRNIIIMNGMLSTAPMVTLMWLITLTTNMALPPSLNFISEITIMMTSLMLSKMILYVLMMSCFSTTMYSLFLFMMTSHSNLYSMINPIKQISSINMTLCLSHLWPLIIMITMPMKFMVWC